jgi:hypothetical protein
MKQEDLAAKHSAGLQRQQAAGEASYDVATDLDSPFRTTDGR